MKTSVDMFQEMMTELYRNLPPQIHAPLAEPCDVDSCNEWLMDFAAIVDKFIFDFAKYISDTIPGGFSEEQMALFAKQLSNALEGNATFELDRAADEIREELFQRSRRVQKVLTLIAATRIH